MTSAPVEDVWTRLRRVHAELMAEPRPDSTMAERPKLTLVKGGKDG